jgi:aryl carrier-like protein
MTDTTIGSRDWLVEMLEQIVDDDLSGVDPSADLSDHGLDSIRVFELVQRLRQVRADVQLADVVDDISIAGLARTIETGADR